MSNMFNPLTLGEIRSIFVRLEKLAEIVKISLMRHTLRAIAAGQMDLSRFWDWFSYFKVTPIHPGKSNF